MISKLLTKKLPLSTMLSYRIQTSFKSVFNSNVKLIHLSHLHLPCSPIQSPITHKELKKMGGGGNGKRTDSIKILHHNIKIKHWSLQKNTVQIIDTERRQKKKIKYCIFFAVAFKVPVQLRIVIIDEHNGWI